MLILWVPSGSAPPIKKSTWPRLPGLIFLDNDRGGYFSEPLAQIYNHPFCPGID
jgi:hypothetical protein